MDKNYVNWKHSAVLNIVTCWTNTQQITSSTAWTDANLLSQKSHLSGASRAIHYTTKVSNLFSSIKMLIKLRAHRRKYYLVFKMYISRKLQKQQWVWSQYSSSWAENIKSIIMSWFAVIQSNCSNRPMGDKPVMTQEFDNKHHNLSVLNTVDLWHTACYHV